MLCSSDIFKPANESPSKGIIPISQTLVAVMFKEIMSIPSLLSFSQWGSNLPLLSIQHKGCAGCFSLFPSLDASRRVHWIRLWHSHRSFQPAAAKSLFLSFIPLAIFFPNLIAADHDRTSWCHLQTPSGPSFEKASGTFFFPNTLQEPWHGEPLQVSVRLRPPCLSHAPEPAASFFQRQKGW